jgi:hypothetical protein
MLMKKTFGILALCFVFLLSACEFSVPPLNLEGDWKGQVTVANTELPVAFSLDARGNILGGTFSDHGSAAFGSYTFSSTVTSSHITITAIASSTIGGVTIGSATVSFYGKVNGDTIAGDFHSVISASIGAGSLDGTFSITRQ